jgi:hypothetical protein
LPLPFLQQMLLSLDLNEKGGHIMEACLLPQQKHMLHQADCLCFQRAHSCGTDKTERSLNNIHTKKRQSKGSLPLFLV